MTFANDCANCCFFRAKKEKFAFRYAKIAQKFCEWKPYEEDIVVFNSDNYLYIVSDTEIASHFRNAKFTL